jgi:hypothetical protein
MAPPRLHLDADTSIKALYTALVARGHDVTRTPTAWMPREACDTDLDAGIEQQGQCDAAIAMLGEVWRTGVALTQGGCRFRRREDDNS